MLNNQRSPMKYSLEAIHDANKENPYKVISISVEGNIGCGKTTFLEHFKLHPIVKVLPEPVEKWKCVQGFNSLDLMYKDARRWSLAFQSYVTLTMLEHHQACLPRQGARHVKMIERSVYSARYCFIENLHRGGLMADVDYAVINEWHDWIKQNAHAHLDLLVYLRSSPDTCQKRIMLRDRIEEKGVPLDYLQSLHRLHEEWLIEGKRGELPAPVMVVDADVELAELEGKIKSLESKILCGQA